MEKLNLPFTRCVCVVVCLSDHFANGLGEGIFPSVLIAHVHAVFERLRRAHDGLLLKSQHRLQVLEHRVSQRVVHAALVPDGPFKYSNRFAIDTIKIHKKNVLTVAQAAPGLHQICC
jgi:hypothetical protein